MPDLPLDILTGSGITIAALLLFKIISTLVSLYQAKTERTVGEGQIEQARMDQWREAGKLSFEQMAELATYLRAEINRKDEVIASLQARLTNAQQDLTAARAEIADLRHRVDDLAQRAENGGSRTRAAG